MEARGFVLLLFSQKRQRHGSSIRRRRPLRSVADEPPQVPEVPLQGPARARPEATDGDPELLEPDADPGPGPRHQRRRPGALLLQHLVDEVLRPEVPRLLRVHLVHLGVPERRRRPQQQHLRLFAKQRNDGEEEGGGGGDGIGKRGSLGVSFLQLVGCLAWDDVCASTVI